MTEQLWTDVDGYFSDLLTPPDQGLDRALERSAAEGLPEIQVSPQLGKFLHLLARIQGARRILEIFLRGIARWHTGSPGLTAGRVVMPRTMPARVALTMFRRLPTRLMLVASGSPFSTWSPGGDVLVTAGADGQMVVWGVE